MRPHNRINQDALPVAAKEAWISIKRLGADACSARAAELGRWAEMFVRAQEEDHGNQRRFGESVDLAGSRPA